MPIMMHLFGSMRRASLALAVLMSSCEPYSGDPQTPAAPPAPRQVSLLLVGADPAYRGDDLSQLERATKAINRSNGAQVVYQARSAEWRAGDALSLPADDRQLCQRLEEAALAVRADEVWVKRAASPQATPFYEVCANGHFAVMTYVDPVTGAPGDGMLVAFAQRAHASLVRTLPAYMPALGEFEQGCGQLVVDPAALPAADRQTCRAFRKFPKLVQDPDDATGGGDTDQAQSPVEAYMGLVLSSLPQVDGTFGGVQTNWWRTIVPFHSENRGLRYPEQRKDACSPYRGVKACISHSSCAWIYGGCWPFDKPLRCVEIGSSGTGKQPCGSH